MMMIWMMSKVLNNWVLERLVQMQYGCCYLCIAVSTCAYLHEMAHLCRYLCESGVLNALSLLNSV